MKPSVAAQLLMPASLLWCGLVGVAGHWAFPYVLGAVPPFIFVVAFTTTFVPFAIFLLLLRRPLLAVAIYIGSVLMRLTALASIAIWLLAKQPNSLREGLLAFLIFVGAFLLFEIVALPACGLHRGWVRRPTGSDDTQKSNETL